MAEIMSKADLCVGAAGSTSWERCCLGLPALIVPIANNQKEIAKSLHNERLAVYSSLTKLKTDFNRFFDLSGNELIQTLSKNASMVCDGLGSARVVEKLETRYEN